MSNKIEDLQVLRGVSILFVLLQHLSITSAIFALTPKRIELPFFLGVEIFFVISGYVIYKSLLKDGFNPYVFIIKRFFRLIPCLFLFILFSFAVNYLFLLVKPEGLNSIFHINSPKESLKESLHVLSGTFLFYKGPSSYTNGAMWSLSVEDLFYGFLAILCFAQFNFKKHNLIITKIILAFVLSFLFITIIANRLNILFSESPKISPYWLNFLTKFRFDFLILGIIISMLEEIYMCKAKLDVCFSKYGYSLCPLAILLPLIMCSISENQYANEKKMLSGFTLIASNLLFGVLVLICSRNVAFPNNNGLFYRSFIALGNRSYLIYLFHFPVMLFTWTFSFYLTKNNWLPFDFGSFNPLSYGIFQLTTTLLVLMPLVEIIHNKIEMPLTKYGKNLVENSNKNQINPILLSSTNIGELKKAS